MEKKAENNILSILMYVLVEYLKIHILRKCYMYFIWLGISVSGLFFRSGSRYEDLGIL